MSSQITNQLVGWFVVQSKMDTFFGPSIVYSSIRVDQIWLWDFWSLGDVFLLKSSLQSKVESKKSHLWTPPQFRQIRPLFVGGSQCLQVGWWWGTTHDHRSSKTEEGWGPLISHDVKLFMAIQIIAWITIMWVIRFWWAAAVVWKCISWKS